MLGPFSGLHWDPILEVFFSISFLCLPMLEGNTTLGTHSLIGDLGVVRLLGVLSDKETDENIFKFPWPPLREWPFSQGDPLLPEFASRLEMSYKRLFEFFHPQTVPPHLSTHELCRELREHQGRLLVSEPSLIPKSSEEPNWPPSVRSGDKTGLRRRRRRKRHPSNLSRSVTGPKKNYGTTWKNPTWE